MDPSNADEPRNVADENDGVRVMLARTCVLCGQEGRMLFGPMRDQMFDAPGVWNLLRCPGCGFAWLNPRPLAEDIGILYRQYHTHAPQPGWNDNRGRWRDWAKESVLASAFGYEDRVRSSGGRVLGRVLSWLEPLRELVGATVMWLSATDRGRLLDVGCGSGGFLKKMQDLGWEASGVEPDPSAARVAREHYGLDVTCETLEEAALSAGQFDVITMNHVIEHLPDPITSLQECGRVLKDTGRLVVTTPNVDSLGRRLFRTSWRGLEVPRHLQLFSVTTLAECVRRAGLHVQEVRTTANSARWMSAASRLLERDGSLSGGAPPRKMPALIRLQGLIFWAFEWTRAWFSPVGEEIVLIAGPRPHG
jgi:2-polyprenyl-3-methyl-5-hydroxy-6-metoxy-1,4-benzoquinol methylase